MLSHWRSVNVLGLCESMRQQDDYSACPILADALEDAGCDDGTLLTELRSERSPMDRQRLVAIVHSERGAEAVRTVERMASDLGPGAICELGEGYGEYVPMTYERLMGAAARWMQKDSHGWGDYTTEHGGESWRDDFPGMAREFWKAWECITGKPVEDDTASFFSCTC